MAHPSFYIIMPLFNTCILLLGYYYFKNISLQRPPIGVFNLWDILLMGGMFVLIHYFYLFLPINIVVIFMFFMYAGALHITIQPVVKNRYTSWFGVGLLLVGNVGTAYLLGNESISFLIVNNVVQIIIIIGICNLWVQGGMKARDGVALAMMVAFFDYFATAMFSLTNDVLGKLSSLPFSPLIAYIGPNNEVWLAGIGDVIFAVLFPLLMFKSFGRRSGYVALFSFPIIIIILLILANTNFIPMTNPFMTIFGPIMLLQYLYWRIKVGPERTTKQYLLAESA